MDNCVFCQIVARILPCDLIYEDDHFLAFLDINPVRQGHTLVISKEHHATMIDMPEPLLGQSFVLSQHIMRAMTSALGCDFIMVAWCSFEITRV
jgi:histidine triad (HIT) family protein